MVIIDLNIYCPGLVEFRNYWCKNFGYITKHKYLEMQFMRHPTLIGFELDTCWLNGDHAGPYFSIGLLTFRFDISVVDNRHWDYHKHTWKEPGHE